MALLVQVVFLNDFNDLACEYEKNKANSKKLWFFIYGKNCGIYAIKLVFAVQALHAIFHCASYPMLRSVLSSVCSLF
jgi:hypothetical protein